MQAPKTKIRHPMALMLMLLLLLSCNGKTLLKMKSLE